MKEKLAPYFKWQKMIVLATLDNNNNPYVSNVYFWYDDEFNLYFLSKLERNHSQHILDNWKVAVSIIDTKKYSVVDWDKQALQIQWTAELLEWEDAKQGFEYYKNNIPDIVKLWENFHSWDIFKADWNNIFKINIRNVKIWDEEKYKHWWEIIIF